MCLLRSERVAIYCQITMDKFRHRRCSAAQLGLWTIRKERETSVDFKISDKWPPTSQINKDTSRWEIPGGFSPPPPHPISPTVRVTFCSSICSSPRSPGEMTLWVISGFCLTARWHGSNYIWKGQHEWFSTFEEKIEYEIRTMPLLKVWTFFPLDLVE